MIRHSPLPVLDLTAFDRARALPQAAVNPLLDLIGAHFLECGRLDRAGFMRLADEAEAVVGR